MSMQTYIVSDVMNYSLTFGSDNWRCVFAAQKE